MRSARAGSALSRIFTRLSPSSRRSLPRVRATSRRHRTSMPSDYETGMRAARSFARPPRPFSALLPEGIGRRLPAVPHWHAGMRNVRVRQVHVVGAAGLLRLLGEYDLRRRLVALRPRQEDDQRQNAAEEDVARVGGAEP